MGAKVSPTARMRDLGFKGFADRRRWILQHSQEILNYSGNHTSAQTMREYHIGGSTLKRIKEGNYPRRIPASGKDNAPEQVVDHVTPADLANAILDMAIDLKSDNIVLRHRVADLEAQVEYLNTQAKLREEEVRGEFVKKLQGVLASPGEP